MIITPLLTLGVSISAIVLTLLFRRSAKNIQFLPRKWGRIISQLSGVSVTMTSIEQLDKNCPYVFAANHQSQFDIFILQGYLNFDFRWLAKKELFKAPLFGYAMRSAGYISVERSHSRQGLKSLHEAAVKIKNGTSVIIFPEGTRSLDGTVQPFKAGAMVLAIKAGVPVVPVAILGTHQVLPAGKLLPKPGRVHILVGKPVETKDYKIKQREELAALIENKVIALINSYRAA